MKKEPPVIRKLVRIKRKLKIKIKGNATEKIITRRRLRRQHLYDINNKYREQNTVENLRRNRE